MCDWVYSGHCVSTFFSNQINLLFFIPANTSTHWFPWSAPNTQYRHYVCSVCWVYWKKYGGLKKPGNQSIEYEQRLPLVLYKVKTTTTLVVTKFDCILMLHNL